ncbi:MAG: hypothetical protein AAF617_07035, partial [Bacteroidota bacterium]
MQLQKYLLIFSIFICLIACKKVDPNKHIDEGNVKDQVYTSSELGWQIKIPQGWDVITKTETDYLTERGLEAMEDTFDVEIDISGVKDLISFRKNRFNAFLSNSEPFEETYTDEWKDNNADVKKLVYETFMDQGINVDSTATEIVQIDGFDFLRFGFRVKSPNNTVVM